MLALLALCLSLCDGGCCLALPALLAGTCTVAAVVVYAIGIGADMALALPGTDEVLTINADKVVCIVSFCYTPDYWPHYNMQRAVDVRLEALLFVLLHCGCVRRVPTTVGGRCRPSRGQRRLHP